MYDKLTQKDIEKMMEEIEYRKLVVRKEALEAVKEARAQGDLSENFEYKAAKQDKNRNESRIRYLERMIKTAHVISDESRPDEAGIGDRVELYIPEDDETETYKLVTTVRGNSLKGLISIDSPLGKALRGRKIGDKIYVRVNEAYGYEAEIRAIDKSAEEEEESLRKGGRPPLAGRHILWRQTAGIAERKAQYGCSEHDRRKNRPASDQLLGAPDSGKFVSAHLQCSGFHHCGAVYWEGGLGGRGNRQSGDEHCHPGYLWDLYGSVSPHERILWCRAEGKA